MCLPSRLIHAGLSTTQPSLRKPFNLWEERSSRAELQVEELLRMLPRYQSRTQKSEGLTLCFVAGNPWGSGPSRKLIVKSTRKLMSWQEQHVNSPSTVSPMS
ncbi:tubulin gamma-1 chain [Striga asiatica]|uniref:Tubulin gamma-1 chain n=1 Tax=Striga asiatica TaxID=4170 RepID=A0A5A7P0T5_STRAF|nr:tubulin gamma-1 chain [Striga asiatica]